ncbi:MAG TPA: hypothetical protein VHE30_22095 [Polyangiaceae bacterium]|nr:hypothetical protein [Polyangiaceae bacterium]
MRRRLFAALCSFLAAACHSTPPPEVAPAAAPAVSTTEIEKYLPLEDGTVFSYDTTRESTGARGVLIVQIFRPREGRVDLKMSAKTERLEILPDGVAYVEGGYLLQGPIQKGRTWRSKTGVVRLDAVDEAVTVPAGQFQGCLKTVEETGEPGLQRVVTTTLCPHVGLVEIDAEAASDSGHERETAVLRSFGPRVDIATGDSVTTTTSDEDAPPPGRPPSH